MITSSFFVGDVEFEPDSNFDARSFTLVFLSKPGANWGFANSDSDELEEL